MKTQHWWGIYLVIIEPGGWYMKEYVHTMRCFLFKFIQINFLGKNNKYKNKFV